jgi:membrane protease YdiL (CAAX protease family)
MNEIADAVEGRRTKLATPRDEHAPPPWGFWSTLAWVVVAFLLGAGLIGGGVLWLNWGQLEAVPETQDDPWFSLQLVVINVVQIVVLAWAARLARWPVGHYLGLVRPRSTDLWHGFAALAVLIGTLEILTHVVGRESVTPFQAEAYRAARAAGVVPLLWAAFVVAAPVGEEIVFRGFLFRGCAASRLGIPGTVLVTSLAFSAAHVQYDWFGVAQTFCIGALFGWLRWRSGSTIVTIILHMAVNFVATAWAAIKAEGLV